MKITERAKKFILRYKIPIAAIFGILIITYITLGFLNKELLNTYKSNQSFFVTDRNNEVIFMSKNQKGYYAEYSESIPQNFKNLLLKKEDKYFYWHFGFNFWSIAQAVANKLGLSQRKASSTISQQLAKILLEEENQRNLSNKFKESFYTIALKLLTAKKIF